MKKLTGRGVLLILAGFFGVVILTNVIFITAAVRTFRGEDEAKPYLQGVEYNHTLARRAEQARLGWRASIDDRRLPSGMVLLTVDVRQPDGKPPSNVVLMGALRHPADEHRDREVAGGAGAARGIVERAGFGLGERYEALHVLRGDRKSTRLNSSHT